jgi:fatty acid-binding protein 3
MDFTGKYKLKSSENFDEYMKAIGVGLVMRKMAGAATPVQDIKVNGDEYEIKTTTTFKTTEVKFKLGEEFEEVRGDGSKCKSVASLDGNKLMQVQKDGNKETQITREFSGNELKMVMKVDDVECTRVYDKIE